MDLHVRRNASDTGYVAYDDSGHSAGGATDNEAIIAFHDRWPEVELSAVDINEHEAVEMIGTPMEEARHQALLDGVAMPDHVHGDLSTALQYISALAARVQALEEMFGGDQSGPVPEPTVESAAENELNVLKHSLAMDWRNYVFKPAPAELMLIGIIPLLRSIIQLGPNPSTLAAIGQWFESLTEHRDAFVTVADYLTQSADLPVEVSSAVQRMFAP